MKLASDEATMINHVGVTNVASSVAEPEPELEPELLEPYHFDPRRTGTGTVSLL